MLSRDGAVHTDEGIRLEEGSEGGGIALSAFALMVMTGVSASADEGQSDAQASVLAIDEIVGTVRSDAVEMSAADMTVTTGGASVELLLDAGDGVAIIGPGGADLGVGLPFADQSDEAAIVDGTVVYDNNNGTTTTPLIQDDGSIQILTTITDSSSPTTFEYPFDVREGASLVLTADGGARVAGVDGSTIASGATPWAVDADGVSVPTWYEVHGTTLVQVVKHRASATAYPVVADPSVSFGVAVYVRYSKSEVTSMTSGLRGAINDKTQFALILCGRIPNWAAKVGCGLVGMSYYTSIYNTFKNAAARNQCVEIQLAYISYIPVVWKGYSC